MHQKYFARSGRQLIKSCPYPGKTSSRGDYLILKRCAIFDFRDFGPVLLDPGMTIIVDADIERRAHKKSGGIVDGILSPVALKTQIGGMQKIFGIVTVTGAPNDLA